MDESKNDMMVLFMYSGHDDKYVIIKENQKHILMTGCVGISDFSAYQNIKKHMPEQYELRKKINTIPKIQYWYE